MPLRVTIVFVGTLTPGPTWKSSSFQSETEEGMAQFQPGPAAEATQRAMVNRFGPRAASSGRGVLMLRVLRRRGFVTRYVTRGIDSV
jgi:hypothetical protein